MGRPCLDTLIKPHFLHYSFPELPNSWFESHIDQEKKILLSLSLAVNSYFAFFYLNAKDNNKIVKALRITNNTFCEVGGRGFHKI